MPNFELLQFLVCFTKMFYKVERPLCVIIVWNWHVKYAWVLICAYLKPRACVEVYYPIAFTIAKRRILRPLRIFKKFYERHFLTSLALNFDYTKILSTPAKPRATAERPSSPAAESVATK
jgi:hypothetical protein